MARNLSWPRRTSPIVSSSSSPSLQRTSCRKGSEASAGAEVPTTVPSKSPTPGKLRRIWTPRRDAATASLYVESASWSSVISGADGRAGRERLRLSRGGGTADRPRGWLESSRKDDEKGAGALWRMRLGYRWGGLVGYIVGSTGLAASTGASGAIDAVGVGAIVIGEGRGLGTSRRPGPELAGLVDGASASSLARRAWPPRRGRASPSMSSSLLSRGRSVSPPEDRRDPRAGRREPRRVRVVGREARMEVGSGAAPRRPAPFWRVVTIRTVTDRGPQATVFR